MTESEQRETDIFKTIENDCESDFSKKIIVNCQYTEWDVNSFVFRYKGQNYSLTLKEVHGKIWEEEQPKTITQKDARKLFKKPKNTNLNT